MDNALIRKFILEVTPPGFRSSVPLLIDSMDTDACQQLGSCWFALKASLESESENIQVQAFNGFFTGICLVIAAARNPEQFEILIGNFLETRRRKRGENVHMIEEARIR